MRSKVSPAADIAAEPVAMVLEFQQGHEPIPEPAMAAVVATREAGDLLDAAIRSKEVEEIRTRFYSLITGMRADLERRTAAPTPVAAREAGGGIEPAPATQVCWLNGTMQVVGKPKDVAYCADEASVRRIGMPRLLEREMDVTLATIGIFAFRAAGNLFDGTGIPVAIIDGECDANHPALAGRIVHKTNFTKEPWGTPDPHGTAAAGILCSTAAALGGICPGATILNYKVFTTNPGVQGTDFSATQAIQSALEDGAKVANLSWGVGVGTNGDSREARAVNRAWRLGLVLVKSAGNRGPLPGTLTSPADAADVIVVGATNRQGTAVEPYSSRGPNGLHAGPDLVAPGGNPAAEIQGLLLQGGTGSAGWGTSFAAPHVSGIVALLLQQNPGLKPNDIRTLLGTKCTLVGNAAGAASAQGLGLIRL